MTDKRQALVTGANKGIGLAIAKGLAQAGLAVWMGARDRTRGEEAVRALRDEGLDVRFLQIDVADDECVRRAAETVGGFGQARRRQGKHIESCKRTNGRGEAAGDYERRRCGRGLRGWGAARSSALRPDAHHKELEGGWRPDQNKRQHIGLRCHRNHFRSTVGER